MFRFSNELIWIIIIPLTTAYSCCNRFLLDSVTLYGLIPGFLFNVRLTYTEGPSNSAQNREIYHCEQDG